MEKQITDLETQVNQLKSDLVPLKQKWLLKEVEREQQVFLLSDPKLSTYYKKTVSKLSASFQALFIMQSGLISQEAGAILSITGKTSSLQSQGESIFNTLVKVNYFFSIVTSILGGIGGFFNPIAYVSPVLQIVDIALSAGQAGMEEKKKETADKALNGVTPRSLEKIAEYIARTLTYRYREQIALLTEKGASSFANAGVIRLLNVLLNGYYEGKGNNAVEALLTTISTIKTKHGPKIPILGELPFVSEKLSTVNHSDKDLTQDILYRKVGKYTEDSVTKERKYYSNDKKKEVEGKNGVSYYTYSYPEAPHTDANKAGYILTDTVPSYMTLDVTPRGPVSLISSGIAINTPPSIELQTQLQGNLISTATFKQIDQLHETSNVYKSQQELLTQQLQQEKSERARVTQELELFKQKLVGMEQQFNQQILLLQQQMELQQAQMEEVMKMLHIQKDPKAVGLFTETEQKRRSLFPFGSDIKVKNEKL